MNDPCEFRLLVLADVHCASRAAGSAAVPADHCGWAGHELIGRAIEDARHHGGFDRIALLGDLLNDGGAPDADCLLAAIKAEIRLAVADAPLLVVPGNHDGDADRLLAALDHRPGSHEIGPYRFVTFADPYEPGDLCTRRQADRRLLRDIAARDGGPIIVLQHNPMNPPISQADYPYMLTNREGVMSDYSSAGVLLSISGHYHPGQPLSTAAGVKYFTAPAISVWPLPYTLIRLRRREVAVEHRRLGPLDGQPTIG